MIQSNKYKENKMFSQGFMKNSKEKLCYNALEIKKKVKISLIVHRVIHSSLL